MMVPMSDELKAKLLELEFGFLPFWLAVHVRKALRLYVERGKIEV